MRCAQFSRLLVAALAMLAANASAETRTAPRAIDTSPLPSECKVFLEVPPDSTSELLPWAQRLSLAACREGAIEVGPVTDPDKLRDTVAALDRAIEPATAIYRDAIANGPAQIRMLAGYGLGMAYVNVAVRARSAIPGGIFNSGDAAAIDRFDTLHRTLEPLLVRDRDRAIAALSNTVALADADPADASANGVMTWVVASARAELALLQTNP